MYGLGPTIPVLICILPQPDLITHLKFNRDFQRPHNEFGIPAFFVRNQPFKHFRIGAQSGRGLIAI